MKFSPKTSKGAQMFTVPNTPEGLEFIKSLRRFLNRRKFEDNTDFTISVRGRGSRKEYARAAGSYAAQSGVSKQYAEFFAVYVKAQSEYARWWKQYQDSCRKDVELRNLKDQIDAMRIQHYQEGTAKDTEISRLQANLDLAVKGFTTTSKLQWDDAQKTIADLRFQVSNAQEEATRCRQERENLAKSGANAIDDLVDQNRNLKESLRTAMQGEILPDTSDIKGPIKITLPNGTKIEFVN